MRIKMFAVGMLGNYISQGAYTFAGPFRPFGGAVDIIVVQQKDGTFKSSPWYVKFSKFQGREKLVDITVNDVPADFHMFLDRRGVAFFEKEGQGDEQTILSLPAASSSVDVGRRKRLTNSKDSSSGELEMQELPKRNSETNAEGVLNDCGSAKSGMSDDSNVAHAETTSTVCVPQIPVNQPDSEDAIAPETKRSLIKEQSGTLNSVEKDAKPEESKLGRSGRRLARPFRPIFGLGSGRKSQETSPETSTHGLRQAETNKLRSSLSLEKAEMIADLLDRKWGTGSRETLLTPTRRWGSAGAATRVDTDNLPSVGTGSLTHGSESSGGMLNDVTPGQSVSGELSRPAEGLKHILNDASCGQSESAELSRPKIPIEGSKQCRTHDSNAEEEKVSRHGLEGSTDIITEASSEKSACEELTMPDFHTEASNESLIESSAMVDLQSDAMRPENVNKSSEFAGEKVSRKCSILDSAAKEQTLVLVSNENLGDASSHNDNFSEPFDERKQKVRFSMPQEGSEQVTLAGRTGGEDVDRSTQGLPSPDDHTIPTRIDAENEQSHNNECGVPVDSSKEFLVGASCSHDLQSAASSTGNIECLESDKGKQPGAVAVSSSVRPTEAEMDSGLNQLSGNLGGPITIEKVPADSLDSESDAGGALRLCLWDKKFTAMEMTPDLATEAKFDASEGVRGTSFQQPDMRSEGMVITFFPAADNSWEKGVDFASEYSVVGKLTAGQNDEDFQTQSNINADQAAAGCMPEDVVRDTKKPATTSDEMFPVQMESEQISGKHMLEQFYSFKEDHMVDSNDEYSEDDVSKNCLYLKELPNCSGDENVVAFLEVDESLFDLAGVDLVEAVSKVSGPACKERHKEQNLSSCKSLDSDHCEQPLEAKSGTFTSVGRSKPIPVSFAIKKKAELTSSASLPSKLHKAEREAPVYSRSLGSNPLFKVTPTHVREDATENFNKNIEERVRMVDVVDMQVVQAIIFGSGKDSEVIVNAADSKSPHIDVDLSLCRHLLSDGMGADAAAKAFASHKVTYEAFQHSGSAVFADEKLVVKIGGRYFSWIEAAPYILDMRNTSNEALQKLEGGIAVETNGLIEDGGSQAVASVPSITGWTLWPFSVRRSQRESSPQSASTIPKQALLTATNLAIASPFTEELLRKQGYRKPTKFSMRTYVPTSQQLASLRLKEGSNKVTFAFSSRVRGKPQVDARIYLWKWDTRIVVSDVDGTITRSDILGQVMPLVGRDWTQSGVTRLFSAIKGNGYELLFLSARAISQAYLTRQFLLNLKQDGAGLPDGPVFISPDGLIPSLYREVIRRAPHEFKITCLQGIRDLFPSDVNPFYAGFGNRDTDEISYLKVGIPKGKIFIINPKGEVVVNHVVDSKSYTSLHTLVDDMFPPMTLCEQEDFNSWNFWKLPLPDIDDELSPKSGKSARKVTRKRVV